LAESSDVLIRNREFVEDITFARPGVSLRLKGGYASDFIARSGASLICALTIEQGTLTIDNLTVTSSSYLPGDITDLWEGGPVYYSEWAHGPSTDTHIFPITVGLQTPSNANAYKAIYVNYKGSWRASFHRLQPPQCR
jgi:hypothetical protein